MANPCQHSIDTELLDRLVDGDLRDDERRTLLAQLDRTPDGWKRCARAFLEAQCWRESLTESAATSAADVRLGVAVARPARRETWPALVVALGVLVAFAAGMTLPRPEETTRFAQTMNPPVSAVEEIQTANQTATAARTVRSLGTMAWQEEGRFNIPGLPGIQVTVFEGPGLDESWLQSPSDAVPDVVARQLERQGCQVKQRSRVLPLLLDDGRRLAVKIDQLDVRIIGRTPVL